MSKWDALEGVKNEERIDKEGVLDLTYLNNYRILWKV